MIFSSEQGDPLNTEEDKSKRRKTSAEIAAFALKQLMRDGISPTPFHYARIYSQMDNTAENRILPDLLESSSLYAEMEEDSWTQKQLEELKTLTSTILLVSEEENLRQAGMILSEIIIRNRRFLKEVLDEKKQFKNTVSLLNQMILQASGTLESASFRLVQNVERLNQTKSLEDAKQVFQQITQESRELLSSIKKIGEDLQTTNKQLLSSSIEANLDPLTGILNRRGLQRRQGSFVGRTITFMVFDADYFKALNDQHGHGAGDQFLRQLVSLVEKNLEGMEHLFCRWGGDEFLVVFTDMLMEDAVHKAEEIRKQVDQGTGSPTIFLPGKKGDHVTISVGLAGGNYRSVGDFDQFFSLADKALYRAKEDGRNKVRAIHLDDRFA